MDGSTSKLIKQLTETYTYESEHGIGHINHEVKTWLRHFVKDLNKIKATLEKEGRQKQSSLF